MKGKKTNEKNLKIKPRKRNRKAVKQKETARKIII